MTNTLPENENPYNDIQFSYENFELLRDLLTQRDTKIETLNQILIDTLKLFDFKQSGFLSVEAMQSIPFSKDFFIKQVSNNVIVEGLN